MNLAAHFSFLGILRLSATSSIFQQKDEESESLHPEALEPTCVAALTPPWADLQDMKLHAVMINLGPPTTLYRLYPISRLFNVT